MTKSLYDYCTERQDDLLLFQWDGGKNGRLSPQDVSFGSHRKIWWKCGRGHQWQSAVYSRTGRGTGCPYCTGRRSHPQRETLASLHPELLEQWHPTKNLGIDPNELPPATHRKVWWICERGHEWRTEVKLRTNGSGCPYCLNRQIIVGENDLATTHPELAAQWDSSRNGHLTPQQVTAGKKVKVWWLCGKGHSWCATVQSRAVHYTGCPVCSGKLVIPGENDLATVFPNLAAQWHPEKNGSLTPREVSPFTNRKVWWKCPCGHEYHAVVAARASTNSSCPYCTGKRVLAGFNDLATKHPAIAAQWYDTLNGELTPRMVTAGSKKKVWWQCADGHVWKAVIYSRTGSRKAGCPVCAGKVKPTEV